MKITIKGQNQQTVLGNLRVGDYFSFQNNLKVYRVIETLNETEYQVRAVKGPNEGYVPFYEAASTPVVPMTLIEMIFEETN